MTTLAEAARLADAFLEEHVRKTAPDAMIQFDLVIECDDFWDFPFQSAEYLRTGVASHLLAGNVPIRVQKKDGSVGRGPGYAAWLADPRRCA